MSPVHASHDSPTVTDALHGRVDQPVALAGTGIPGIVHRAGLRR